MGNTIKKCIIPLEEKPNFKSSFSANLLPTIFYFILFTMFGMCIGIMGPSMPHLQCQINATQSGMSIVFLIQLVAMLLATLASGSLVKIMEPHLLLVINALMLTLSTCLVMVARSSVELAIILTVMGFNMGCIDSLSNVMLINLYKLHIGPFIQIMHFLYGFGALITQLSIDPFLQYLSTNCTKHLHDVEKQEQHFQHQNKLLSYPFWIMGIIETIMFLILVLLYNMIQSSDQTQQSNKSNTTKPTNPAPAKVKSKGYLHVIIVILIAGLVSILDGMQSEFNVLVYSYAVNSGVNESERSYDSFLNFTFWGTLSIGRFVAIIISLWCRTYVLLVADIIGLFFGVLLLVCGQGHSDVLYAATCIIGLCLSNTTPGVLSLSEEYINLTKWRTTFIIFSAAAGEALLPFIFGTLMDNVGPIVFPVGNVILVIIIMGNFFTFYKLGITTTKYSEKVTRIVVDVPKPGETVHVKHYSRMDSVDNL